MKELIKEAVKEILMGGSAEQANSRNSHPLLGELVLVRARNAGVHYGKLKGTGDFIHLSDSHRIWKWEGAFTLSEVSQVGELVAELP